VQVVARAYEVSEATVSRWLARYRVEGDAAFEPRSRRPLHSLSKISDDITSLIVNLRRELTAAELDAGPSTIPWHLEHRHQITVSISKIR
jgi:transposase